MATQLKSQVIVEALGADLLYIDQLVGRVMQHPDSKMLRSPHLSKISLIKSCILPLISTDRLRLDKDRKIYNPHKEKL